MRAVLLDTQVFVGAYLGTALPSKVLALFRDASIERILSTASLLEIAIKNTLGKLDMTEQQTREAARDLALTILPVKPQHVYRVFALPHHHRDPFDRAIIATALVEQLPIVGGDRQFQNYAGLRVIW